MTMKIEQIKGRLLLKKPKIIDPLNETETIKDVMLVDGKIDEIGIIDTENDFNFIGKYSIVEDINNTNLMLKIEYDDLAGNSDIITDTTDNSYIEIL